MHTAYESHYFKIVGINLFEKKFVYVKEASHEKKFRKKFQNVCKTAVNFSS